MDEWTCSGSDDAFARDSARIRLDNREAQSDQIRVAAVFMVGNVVQKHAGLLQLAGASEQACIDGPKIGIAD